MTNRINSYARKTLSGRSPYGTFQFLHGADALKKLGTVSIPPDEVTLHPPLLKKQRKTNASRQNRHLIATPFEGWDLPFQRNGLFPFTVRYVIFARLGPKHAHVMLKTHP
jgi:hypothetical protein